MVMGLGTLIILIVQRRRLRHREIEYFSQGQIWESCHIGGSCFKPPYCSAMASLLESQRMAAMGVWGWGLPAEPEPVVGVVNWLNSHLLNTASCCLHNAPSPFLLYLPLPSGHLQSRGPSQQIPGRAHVSLLKERQTPK